MALSRAYLGKDDNLLQGDLIFSGRTRGTEKGNLTWMEQLSYEGRLPFRGED